MSNLSLSRRQFLKSSSTAAVGATALGASSVFGIEPLARPGGPRFDLSLAAYSFRNFFEYMRTKKREVADRKMDMFQFIDYCADQGLAGTELTSYFFPSDAGAEYFAKIRQHAAKRGIKISGTAVGNNFARPKGPELDQEIADVKREEGVVMRPGREAMVIRRLLARQTQLGILTRLPLHRRFIVQCLVSNRRCDDGRWQICYSGC